MVQPPELTSNMKTNLYKRLIMRSILKPGINLNLDSRQESVSTHQYKYTSLHHHNYPVTPSPSPRSDTDKFSDASPIT